MCLIWMVFFYNKKCVITKKKWKSTLSNVHYKLAYIYLDDYGLPGLPERDNISSQYHKQMVICKTNQQ